MRFEEWDSRCDAELCFVDTDRYAIAVLHLSLAARLVVGMER